MTWLALALPASNEAGKGFGCWLCENDLDRVCLFGVSLMMVAAVKRCFLGKGRQKEEAWRV